MQYYAAISFDHSFMRKVHIFRGRVVYEYWIDTVYVQNNLKKLCIKVVILHDFKGL